MEKIQKLRKGIDQIDTAILKLLHKRIRIVKHIKDYKNINKSSIFSPEREIKIISNLLKKNNAIYPVKSLLKIYNEIFSTSRRLQMPLRIGYLGPEGTYSHQAAENIFGSQSIYQPLNSIKNIFTELENEQLNYGVVPIENSTEGIVGYTLDMLIEYNHYIIQEAYLEISNYIVSREKSLDRIKYLYSIPIAIAQCRAFVENNLKNVKIIETSSTAEAARLCLSKKNTAAIAGKKAADMYHLQILAEKVNDNINNFTRFFITAKMPNTISEAVRYKTSLIIGIKDKPGALFSIISPFNKHKINMTKIESRPTKKKPWEYIFFIELLGSLKQSKVQKAIHETEKLSTYLKILGSYPINNYIL